MNAAPNSGPRRSFTMAELLVVISIIVLLTIIALPSFKAIIDSSQEAMAESMLRSAVRVGRDAAVRAGEGTDAALVFFYAPGGRLTMAPYVRSGSVQEFGTSGLATVEYEIFTAAPGGQTVQLPKGWMVRAYAPLNSIEADLQAGVGWYNCTGLSQGSNPRYDPDKGNWIFPETNFFDSGKAANKDGIHRQTFMLRFRGGTGELLSVPADPVLVFAPNLDSRGGRAPAIASNQSLAELRRSDPDRYIRRALAGQFSGAAAGGTARVAIASLVSRSSSDMVLTRAVTQIALYEERKLAAALGVDVDAATGCLYAFPRNSADTSLENLTLPLGPQLIGDIRSNPGGVLGKIAPWFEGANVTDDPKYLDPDYPPSAKLYGVDRYAGALRPIVMQGLSSQ